MQPNENSEYTLNTTEIDGEDGSIILIPDWEAIELAVLDGMKDKVVETMLDCGCSIPDHIQFTMGCDAPLVPAPLRPNHMESQMHFDIRRFLRWLFPRQYQ